MPTKLTEHPLRRGVCLRHALGIAAVLLASLPVSFAPAHAAASTVPYQKSKVLPCGGNSCLIDFGTVEENRRIHLHSVSCAISSDPGASELEFVSTQLSVGDSERPHGKQYESLVPVRRASYPKTAYTLKHRVNLVAQAGDRISTYVQVNAPLEVSFFLCKIAGYKEKLD